MLESKNFQRATPVLAMGWSGTGRGGSGMTLLAEQPSRQTSNDNRVDVPGRSHSGRGPAIDREVQPMEMKKFAAGAVTASALGLGALGAGIGLAHADSAPPVPGNPGHSHSDNPGLNPGGNQGDQSDQGRQPGNGDRDDVNAPRVRDDITAPRDRDDINAPREPDDIGGPGNPLPPGHGFLPPPGHGGPMPQNGIPYPAVPSWVNIPVAPPVGAPPQPPVPAWATGLPVVWNPDRAVWGVWDAANDTFEPF